MADLIDNFRGDDAHLVECIDALIDLNDANALVPHGIGGHARDLLSAAAVRLSRPSQSPDEREAIARIEQCDRDAAADEILYRGLPRSLAAKIGAGEMDDHRTVQAFANHRLIALRGGWREAIEAAAAEAERVGNFGDYGRDELTADFGQPRFDMMHKIIAAIRALTPKPEAGT